MQLRGSGGSVERMAAQQHHRWSEHCRAATDSLYSNLALAWAVVAAGGLACAWEGAAPRGQRSAAQHEHSMPAGMLLFGQQAQRLLGCVMQALGYFVPGMERMAGVSPA